MSAFDLVTDLRIRYGFQALGAVVILVAGLTIIFTKPFRVGEHVSRLGVQGVVASIDLATTVLLHDDRSRVVIPTSAASS